MITRPVVHLLWIALLAHLGGASRLGAQQIPASPYAPGVNLDQTFPGQQPPRAPTGPPTNPFPGSNDRPMALPEPQGEVRQQEKVVNIDTALAAFMKDLGNFSAAGNLEMWTTNQNSLDLNRFPFIMVVKDGRIRFDLDLRRIPTDGEDNFFATLRQVGIHRMQTITLPQLTTVQVLFPHAKSFVTRGLPFEDVPGLIRFTRRRFGPTQINEKTYEKYDVSLNYNTGDRVPMEVWEPSDKPGEPAYVRFTRGQSSVTVSFTTIRRGDVADEFFTVPKDFQKFSDMGVMLQTVSARHERDQSGRAPRAKPLIVRPNPDGSFNRGPR